MCQDFSGDSELFGVMTSTPSNKVHLQRALLIYPNITSPQSPFAEKFFFLRLGRGLQQHYNHRKFILVSPLRCQS